MCVQVLYLCTVAALRVVVVLGGKLAVCVFIRGYTVIVMLVIINAQIKWVCQRKKKILFITHVNIKCISPALFISPLEKLRLIRLLIDFGQFSFHYFNGGLHVGFIQEPVVRCRGGKSNVYTYKNILSDTNVTPKT